MIHPVRIPHEQVNDQSVLLVEWIISDGGEVKAGQPIAVIETSKSTAEIAAPEAGFLRHGAKANSELPVGAVFCHVTTLAAELVPSLTAASQEVPVAEVRGVATATPQPSTASVGDAATESPGSRAGPSTAETTFSRKAAELVEQHGLSKQLFAGKGLVRESDVQAVLQGTGSGPAATPRGALAGSPPPAAPAANASPRVPIAAAGVPVRIEDLSRAKRVEINYLSSGLEHTLPSVVTVPCGTPGLLCESGPSV